MWKPPAPLVRQVCGWTLIAAGVIAGVIPILQGWILILAGLALVAKDSAMAARVQGRLQRRFPGAHRRAQDLRARLETWFQKKFRKKDMRQGPN